jgi:arginine decarboxylase-like protein
MGRRIFLVVEKLNELKLITSVAKRLNVRPNVGIRIKLSSSGSGKWEESGGDRSKFGLNTSELQSAMEFLQDKKMVDSPLLTDFHAVWNNLKSLYLRELPDLAYQEIPSAEEIEDSLITILSIIK